ncbi:hypothetical protein TRFO_11994 [Tritrichomonas foetus]|uniref:Uncharacterized protein n=1 Tax=Tritrichomonas foetus TaxID=1144522 RepID=A0A1J4J687_9EUKA|nr:hypothetical protein TRFO_11994 [Tritrichomonas foetus]|eukprot:OHS93179.1 hypothetical protein TRFO_11994 [Tritrichomonas foetus]
MSSSISLQKDVHYSTADVTISYEDLSNFSTKTIFYFPDQQNPPPPSSISFIKRDRNTYLDDSESGQDDETTLTVVERIINCKDWKKVVSHKDSAYSSSKCETIEGDFQKLVVSSKSNKLSPGPFAGIVTACIVVAAVFVGAAIYLSKMKNRSLDIESD